MSSVCFDTMHIRHYVGMNEAEAEIPQADLPSSFGGAYLVKWHAFEPVLLVMGWQCQLPP